jgi:O-antigen/teichoic acid export membrane protein
MNNFNEKGAFVINNYLKSIQKRNTKSIKNLYYIISEIVIMFSVNFLFFIYVVRVYDEQRSAIFVKSIAIAYVFSALIQFGSQGLTQLKYGASETVEILKRRFELINYTIFVSFIICCTLLIILVALGKYDYIGFLMWAFSLALYYQIMLIIRLKEQEKYYLAGAFVMFFAAVSSISIDYYIDTPEITSFPIVFSLVLSSLVIPATLKTYDFGHRLPSLLLIKTYLVICAPITVSYVVYILSNRGIVLFVNNLLSFEDIIFLAISYQIMSVLIIFSGIFSKVVNPIIMISEKAYRENVEKYHRIYVASLVGIYLILVSLAELVAKFIYGIEFSSDQNYTFMLIGLSYVIYNFRGIKNTIFLLREKTYLGTCMVIIYFLSILLGIFTGSQSASISIVTLAKVTVLSSLLSLLFGYYYYAKLTSSWK